MFQNKKTYTVESVTSGHPDKVCDQISDAILDAYLEFDPNSRVAMETFGCHNLLVVGGEVTSKVSVDAEKIARNTYKQIGYFHPIKVITNIVKQSPDIAAGVDIGGAGDQGIMYGYATDETEQYLPKAVVLAHKLTQGLEHLRRSYARFAFLEPDGKAQVTMNNGDIKTILVSCQHKENADQEEMKILLNEYLIEPLVGDTAGIQVLVNPTGRFIKGGFEADTGLTGRKIMVDTYGGLAPHGGGAFSGKDPTKVDRSAAYMTRFAAKNIVANGLAKDCLVSVAYAIGRAEPLMVEVRTGDGGDVSDSLVKMVNEKFDFRPRAIIERLGLLRPIYQKTAAYGHFGKEEFPWEEIISL